MAPPVHQPLNLWLGLCWGQLLLLWLVLRGSVFRTSSVGQFHSPPCLCVEKGFPVSWPEFATIPHRPLRDCGQKWESTRVPFPCTGIWGSPWGTSPDAWVPGGYCGMASSMGQPSLTPFSILPLLQLPAESRSMLTPWMARVKRWASQGRGCRCEPGGGGTGPPMKTWPQDSPQLGAGQSRWDPWGDRSPMSILWPSRSQGRPSLARSSPAPLPLSRRF